MNADDFVEAIYSGVYESAIKSVMKLLSNGPPGRRPRSQLVELSRWFGDLAEEDREQLEGVVRLAAYYAVFDFLAALDGNKTIDDEPTEFYLRTGTGECLNRPPFLHEIFSATVYEEPEI